MVLTRKFDLLNKNKTFEKRLRKYVYVSANPNVRQLLVTKIYHKNTNKQLFLYRYDYFTKLLLGLGLV